MGVEEFTKRTKQRIKFEDSFRIAAIAGSLEEVRKLSEHVNINAHTGQNGTALQEAAARGFIDIVQFLLENGAEGQFQRRLDGSRRSWKLGHSTIKSSTKGTSRRGQTASTVWRKYYP